ncbi:MAG: hypothetical protein JST11_32075, partial [Acidobacteria bacterium]|nr:hypothetical protein [Acidobacteriota bacterium]
MQRQAFDSGYLQRLAQGHPETERDFAAYFRELLGVKLRPRLRSADLVEDVIQETFARVFKAIRDEAIGTPEALGSFVNSVCNHILFEVYRQQARTSDGPAEEAAGGAEAE